MIEIFLMLMYDILNIKYIFEYLCKIRGVMSENFR